MSKDRLLHLSGISLSRQQWIDKLLPHLIAIVVFLAVAVVYCKPAFEGKVLYQEDILQWKAMARNSVQYKEAHGRLPLWTNGMFSGMPAYQILIDGDVIHLPSFFYNIFTLHLINPAAFFFLAALSFYFLAGVLRVNPYIAIIGGLAFAYSTYNPVIISVGHETKMQSIAMLPAFIGGILLIFEKRYWQGMALSALFGAILISFGHMQIVYYGFIAVGCMFVAYAIRWIRQKDYKHLRRSIFICAGAALIGVFCNAILLFITYDSSKETVRGGSELADNQSNYTGNGLSETAAFDFSMSRAEPLVMLVPYIFGGTTDLILPAGRSNSQTAYEKMTPELSALIGEDGPRYYWGGIGDLVAGPPYAGAIICFLAIVGFFVLDNRHKWWILAACVLTIMMSWGGYFSGFNGFLLKYLPGYNKFRAPSMIIVIPTFLLCVMAVLTLEKIRALENKAALWRQYRKGLLLMGAIFTGLAILCWRFNYMGPRDADLLKAAAHHGDAALVTMRSYLSGLRVDRQILFRNSLLRSFGLIAAAVFLMTWYIRRRMPVAVFLSVLGVLTVGDLLDEDWKYLNYENYNEKLEYQQNFAASPVDKEILKDSGYYRVFDLRDSIGNALSYGAMTAYFHRSIGGYHAAKLRIYEDLINSQLMNYPHCQPVLDMLNTKYIIKRAARVSDSSGVTQAPDSLVYNAGALGAAWFVQGVRFENTPRAVMSSLTHLDVADTAVLFAADSARVILPRLDPDPDASIELINNDNDIINYVTESTTPQFAVFSEVFYKRGWRACIDDFRHEVPIIRTNYALRGISVPAGRHIIRFVFRPKAFYLGRQLQWMASIILILLLLGALMVSLHARGLHIRIWGHHVLNFPGEHLSSS